MTNKTIKNLYPSDWIEYKFDDLFEFEGGMSLSRAKLSDEGICYLHYGDIHKSNDNYIDVDNKLEEIPKYNTTLDNIKDKYLLRNGDIVFADASEDYEAIGKSIVVINKSNTPFISGLHTITAKDKTDLLDNTYKRYFLLDWNIRKQIMVLSTGISVLGINKGNLKTVRVLLPPLKEQSKIGRILSTWDKTIELKEKLIEQKKEQKKGLMQKLLTGEVRFPGFHEEWRRRKIGELITESRIVAEEPDLDKRITVRLNLKGVQKREVSAVEKKGATTQYVRKAGQFIYGKQNLHKGAIGIIPKELDGFQSSSDIPAFDFNNGVHKHWFFYYLSRESFYTYLEVISTGTGSKRINPKDLFQIKINVPPYEEQQQISNVLSCQDEEINLLEKELEELRQQKKGLMQLLLIGKVRVKV